MPQGTDVAICVFQLCLLGLFFQLYLDACARAILFCARALFINLIDVCI